MLENRKNRAGFAIRCLDGKMRKYMDRSMRDRGIDATVPMHGWIIKYLVDHADEAIYQKDIEKNFSISRSHVTAILQCLEGQGIIRREAVEHDARLKKVVLTEKGIEIDQAIRDSIDAMDQDMIRGVDEKDLEVFYKVCDMISSNMQERK